MQEILTILSIGGVLLGIAAATYTAAAPILTEVAHKRKLRRLAEATRRTYETVHGRAAK